MRREQKWIQAILRRNSREAAEKLIDAYYDDIYGYAYRQIGNREDALDLTRDIFIASLRSLAAFDDRKAGFRTWLYGIASHKIIDSRGRSVALCCPLNM